MFVIRWFSESQPVLDKMNLKCFTTSDPPLQGQPCNQALCLHVIWPFCLLLFPSTSARQGEAGAECQPAEKGRHSPVRRRHDFGKIVPSLTLNMTGREMRRRREPAISSGTAATESNHMTGNMTCCRSLNKYSMPGTLCSKMFNCSLISTLMGIEDSGSNQKELSWSSGSGCTPYWNCSA